MKVSLSRCPRGAGTHGRKHGQVCAHTLRWALHPQTRCPGHRSLLGAALSAPRGAAGWGPQPACAPPPAHAARDVPPRNFSHQPQLRICQGRVRDKPVREAGKLHLLGETLPAKHRPGVNSTVMGMGCNAQLPGRDRAEK